MLSSTMRRFALLTTRRAVSCPSIATFRYLAPFANVALFDHAREPNVTPRHFFSTEQHDIEDESDIIELGKEELEEMKHGPDYKTFDTQNKSRKNNVGFDIEDESDIIELAKEEKEDMAKGIDISDRKMKAFQNKKLVLDIEDESDVIEYAKAAGGENEPRRGRKTSAAGAKAHKDGIEFDIEDESDLIEVAKEEIQEMEKQTG